MHLPPRVPPPWQPYPFPSFPHLNDTFSPLSPQNDQTEKQISILFSISLQMASLLPFPATGIRTYASSDHRRSNPHRSSKPSSASASANPNWWAPIFGWSSEPDYIDGDDRSRAQISDPDSGRAGSRFTPGCFTEEKAKELRKKTMESANFHDIMYHSAIASRLASDLPDKPSRR